MWEKAFVQRWINFAKWEISEWAFFTPILFVETDLGPILLSAEDLYIEEALKATGSSYRGRGVKQILLIITGWTKASEEGVVFSISTLEWPITQALLALSSEGKGRHEGRAILIGSRARKKGTTSLETPEMFKEVFSFLDCFWEGYEGVIS